MRKAFLGVVILIVFQGLAADALAADAFAPGAPKECREPGRVSNAQDQAQAALQILERYSRLLAKGSEEIDQGRYAEARMTLEEAVRINPGSPWAYHKLAWALFFQGDLDGAIRVMTEANIAAESARGYIDLAFFLLQKKNPAQALVHAKRAVKLEPKSMLAHNRLGECHLGLGDHGAAIAAFKKANSLQENSASHVLIGRALMAQNKRAEAFKSFERAAKIDPDAAWIVHEAKARIERAEGRPEAAAGFLTRAIEAAALPLIRSQLTDDLVALFLEIGDHPRAAALYGDRRWIGVTISRTARGFEIADVVKNGPADLAGLIVGDILLDFEGLPLAGVEASRFIGELLGSVPHGGIAKLKIERQGRSLDMAVVVGLSPELPRLAREAASVKPAATSSPPASDAPAIVIAGLAVNPSPVAAGGDFAVDIRFTITVPSGPADLPVTLTCAITQKGETVYEPAPASFEAPNGRPFEVSRKLSAGTRSGDYVIRVHLAWESLSVDRSVGLAIK